MKLGTFTITHYEYRRPCVYEFISDGKVIYVGAGGVRTDTTYGFARAFSRRSNGHDPNRVLAYDEADAIRVTTFTEQAEAAAEEERLIRLLKPKYNVHFTL